MHLEQNLRECISSASPIRVTSAPDGLPNLSALQTISGNATTLPPRTGWQLPPNDTMAKQKARHRARRGVSKHKDGGSQPDNNIDIHPRDHRHSSPRSPQIDMRTAAAIAASLPMPPPPAIGLGGFGGINGNGLHRNMAQPAARQESNFSSSNPFQSGSRPHQHQRSPRRRPDPMFAHVHNNFANPAQHYTSPGEPSQRYPPSHLSNIPFMAQHRPQPYNRTYQHRQSMQANHEADRIRLANNMLKQRLRALGQAAYHEFANSIRAWCEAAGIDEDDPEPMDWQPEKETPVHVVYITPVSSPAKSC